ncbi:ATP-binding protein, partial [Bacillus sp. B-TM1]
PDWIELTKMEDLNLDELDKLGFPLVVKPNSGGSSVGVKIVYDKDELISMLETVFEWDSEVVIEQYIKGDEITCSILDGKPLPIVSIRHAAEFFDYNAKYDDASTVEEVIELPAEINERVNKASLACYKALKCSVYPIVCYNEFPLHLHFLVV